MLGPRLSSSGEDHAIRARTLAARDFRLEIRQGFYETGGDQLGIGRPLACVCLLLSPRRTSFSSSHTPLVPMVDSLSITNPYDILLPHHIVFFYSSRCEAHKPPFSRCVLYPVNLMVPARVSLWHTPAVPRHLLRCSASPSSPTSAVGTRERNRHRPGLGAIIGLRGGKRERRRAADREKGWELGQKRTGNHDVTSLVRRRSWSRRGPRPHLGRSCINGWHL